MRLRIVALTATALVAWASVASADVCSSLAFAFAQDAESMTAKDLVSLRQCVNAHIAKKQPAKKPDPDRAGKGSLTGKKKRYSIL